MNIDIFSVSLRRLHSILPSRFNTFQRTTKHNPPHQIELYSLRTGYEQKKTLLSTENMHNSMVAMIFNFSERLKKKLIDSISNSIGIWNRRKTKIIVSTLMLLVLCFSVSILIHSNYRNVARCVKWNLRIEGECRRRQRRRSLMQYHNIATTAIIFIKHPIVLMWTAFFFNMNISDTGFVIRHKQMWSVARALLENQMKEKSTYRAVSNCMLAAIKQRNCASLPHSCVISFSILSH